MGIEEETEAVDDAFKQNWYSIDMTSLLNNVSVGIKRMASSNSQKILGVGTSPSRNGSAAAALPLMSAEDRSSPQ